MEWLFTLALFCLIYRFILVPIWDWENEQAEQVLRRKEEVQRLQQSVTYLSDRLSGWQEPQSQ